MTNTRAGDKRQSTGELFLAHIDYCLVQSEVLRLLDGDSPGKLEGKVKVRALGTRRRPRAVNGG